MCTAVNADVRATAYFPGLSTKNEGKNAKWPKRLIKVIYMYDFKNNKGRGGHNLKVMKKTGSGQALS